MNIIGLATTIAGGAWLASGRARTHTSGQFSFVSIVPALYPHRSGPAHVHIHG